VRRRVRAIIAAVALASLVVAGCTGPPGTKAVWVQVANETDIPIGVYVDGEWRGTDEPGATILVPLGDGPPPLTIEARSPTGATLATLEATAGQVEALRQGSQEFVLGEEFGVPCGVIRIVVGAMPEGWAVAPGEAVQPGPCP
jgi:hypothetical protein